MIVEAFAAGDRDLLKSLLSPELFKAFDAAITEREKAGQTMMTEIHAIRKTDIVEARMLERRAVITVRFVADETVVVRNAAGEILSGHPDRITETIDIWTFGRDTRSKDPTWLLLATREEAGDTGNQS
jgi:predicted lipid-binding transport protein (Tim44 family)